MTTRIIAVGQSGDGMYSDDAGVTWTFLNIATVAPNTARGVAWFDHISEWWLWGGFGALAMSSASANGTVWVDKEESADADWNAAGTAQRIVYCASLAKYLATFEGSNVLTSSDLLTWDIVTTASGTSGVRACDWSPDLGRAVIGQAAAANGSVKYSDDLTTWTQVSTGITVFPLNNVLWCTAPASCWVAVAQGQVSTSPDGITWTKTNLTNAYWGLAYSPSLHRILVMGDGTAYVYSDDGGLSWNAGTCPSGGPTWGVIWVEELGIFVSTNGGSGGVSTSPDGITWTSRVSAMSVGIADIAFRAPSGLGLVVGFMSLR